MKNPSMKNFSLRKICNKKTKSENTMNKKTKSENTMILCVW